MPRHVQQNPCNNVQGLRVKNQSLDFFKKCWLQLDLEPKSVEEWPRNQKKKGWFWVGAEKTSAGANAAEEKKEGSLGNEATAQFGVKHTEEVFETVKDIGRKTGKSIADGGESQLRV